MTFLTRPGRLSDQRQLSQLGKHQSTKGENVWLVEGNGAIWGYLVTRPVPGLAHIAEIDGYVSPDKRGQGFGTNLLNTAQTDLKDTCITQLSYCITSLDTPTARFLQNRGFFVEHEEWEMSLALEGESEIELFPAGYTTRTHPAPYAASLFRTLYDACFRHTPAYQPYQSDAEVLAELRNEVELLFLYHNDVPIGFVWMRQPRPGCGEIEPIGIIPSYQQQGHAFRLLHTCLKQSYQQGQKHIQLGVWQTNIPAIKLYKRLGFQKTAHSIYLAYNLK